ncbi:MAG: hypothetical protein H7338_06180 [Candidatus Sericytochromatia bacterium]|nr:hypothetical protein [Candidatus Sericytochromatia bacterium]
MIQTIALLAGILLSVAVTVPASGAPILAASPLVAVPAIGHSRQGGAPVQAVSRGASRTPIDVSHLSQLFSLPGGLPCLPASVDMDGTAPQRSQVLALRQRIKTRYRGQGRGARLAIEIP